MVLDFPHDGIYTEQLEHTGAPVHGRVIEVQKKILGPIPAVFAPDTENEVPRPRNSNLSADTQTLWIQNGFGK